MRRRKPRLLPVVAFGCSFALHASGVITAWLTPAGPLLPERSSSHAAAMSNPRPAVRITMVMAPAMAPPHSGEQFPDDLTEGAPALPQEELPIEPFDPVQAAPPHGQPADRPSPPASPSPDASAPLSDASRQLPTPDSTPPSRDGEPSTQPGPSLPRLTDPQTTPPPSPVANPVTPQSPPAQTPQPSPAQPEAPRPTPTPPSPQPSADIADPPPPPVEPADQTEPAEPNPAAQPPTPEPDQLEGDRFHDEQSVDTPIRFEQMERPERPALSRRMNETGTVRILVRVGVDGKLVGYEVVDDAGSPRLTDAAERALKRSTFRPAMKDGKPVAAIRVIEYRFE